jgi:TolA-binding protein
MDEIKLKQLLKQADTNAKLIPLDSKRLSRAVRGRVHRRKTVQRYGMMTAAAAVLVVFIVGQRQYQLHQKQLQITRLEKNIEELKQSTEETLALVQEMLQKQKQQDAERQLILARDPIREQVEEAAFILVYQADRMMEKYNNTETAIDYYNQVIKHFSDTSSAQTARQRLSEIEKQNQPDHI